ncbi:hypothetical protein K7432_003915 [Basidiobolus ranarum]|uniref:GYF domain-containing protein n=1 Tax=Basidiobolus ranarum TaxID=34480 RepID=A0ABR2W5I2_9FUNG
MKRNAEQNNLEFDFAEALEQPRRRRGAVNLDGYGSEAASSESEGEEAAPVEEDMFAEPEPKPTQQLNMNDIEGQIFDSNTELNENGEPILEAFNMKEELEEGSFDSQGNYVRNKKDPNAFHDSWLEGVTKTDMEKAKKAQEKQDAIRRAQENKEHRELGQWTSEEMKKEILNLMKPGETVLNTLSRLNGGRKKNPRIQQRKNKRKADELNAESESPAQVAEEEKKKKAIERMTDLCDRMMAAGDFNIYEQTYEQIVRSLRLEDKIPDDWVPGTQLLPPFSEIPEVDMSDDVATDVASNDLWEYKWVGVENNDETYGPYPTSDMKSWKQQGFFYGGSIVVRRVNQADSPFLDLETVNFDDLST